MTYAFTQDVPINTEIYNRIVDGLGTAPADGLIVHLAIELPEGGLRYIDVWESEADWDRFAEERLHPAVHPVLSALTGGQIPAEPERTPLAVVDVWRGQGQSRHLAAVR